MGVKKTLGKKLAHIDFTVVVGMKAILFLKEEISRANLFHHNPTWFDRISAQPSYTFGAMERLQVLSDTIPKLCKKKSLNIPDQFASSFEVDVVFR